MVRAAHQRTEYVGHDATTPAVRVQLGGVYDAVSRAPKAGGRSVKRWVVVFR
jgi:hypothetical protein